MADRYWVGGTANWDGTAGTKWATTSGGAGGASVPTSADAVFFTNLSTGTCTVSTGNTGALSIDCTGFTGTLTGSGALTVSGNITISAGMTLSLTNILTINGTSTIITANKSFPNLVINGAGITVTLGDGFISIGSLEIAQGTFTTANFAVTLTSNFTMTGSLSRTINLGSSTFSTPNLQVFNPGTATVNAGTSNINISQGIFTGGGKTYNNLIFQTGITSIQLNDANTFNQLLINATLSARINKVQIGANQTITTMVCSGNSANQRIMLFSDVLGTARTINATTWTTVSDVDFRDITLTNAKSPTRGGDCGGNTGITFPAAKTVYWNLAGTQDWSAIGWAASSGGAPAANNFPLAQDTAVFDNAGSVTQVSATEPWNVGNIDSSGRTTAMTLSIFINLFSVYGSWVNGSGISLGGPGNTVVFAGRSIQTIISNGKVFPYQFFMTCPGGTVLLADAFTATAASNTTLQAGTLNLNGNTFTTSSAFDVNTNTTLARNITFNGGTISTGSDFLTNSGNFTTTAGTGTGVISLTSASAKGFSGGTTTFNCTLNQGGAGALTITSSSCTLSDITNTYKATGATTITFGTGVRTFTNWSAVGEAGRVLTINSSVAGSQRIILKSSGTVSVSHCSIQDSNAGGGAIWEAFTTNGNTNVGNNSGWLFSAPPPNNGNFLAFFI